MAKKEHVRALTRQVFKFGTLGAAFVAVWLIADWSARRDSGATGLSASAEASQLGSPRLPDPQPAVSVKTQRQAGQIVNEPKTIDPATLMPEVLAVPVTVEFSGVPLQEIADWLQSERGITTFLDTHVLDEADISPSEPITDCFENEPLYLLLNRLRSKNVDWYLEDGILVITTVDAAEARMSPHSYSVGDLFAAGCELKPLNQTLQMMVSGGWLDDGSGAGTIEWMGNIVFVRQTDRQHREIAGLLTALRRPARRTFTYDPPQHEQIRARLGQNVSTNFAETPLVDAVAELASAAGLDLRLDDDELRAADIDSNTPISLQLADRKFSTVLELMTSQVELAWTLQNGVLWITSPDKAESNLKTAVYDVRDLCGTWEQSDALVNAIHSQTVDSWLTYGTGEGTLDFPMPGVMAVRNTEVLHNQVLGLLTMYRQAIAESGEGDHGGALDEEIVTYYYRLPANVAIELYSKLPQLVAAGSWGRNNDANSELPGRIVVLESPPELIGRGNRSVINVGETNAQNVMVVPQKVLRITQTRANHLEIARFLEQVRSGQEPELDRRLGFGGGGGLF